LKKNGIMNRDIAAVLAKLGHTDRIVIADCGLPIPNHVECIDISLQIGEPSFLSVLYKIAEEMEVEAITLAEEIKIQNQKVNKNITSLFNGKKINYLTHESLKQQVYDVKAIIRTGEATPFSNVILQAGVIF